MNLSEQILAQSTVKKEPITISEWGKHGENLYLHELNAQQRDQYGFDASQNPAKFAKGFSVRIIIDTLHDEDGNPIFKSEQAQSLANQSGTLLSKIAAKSQKLSGLSEDSIEDAEKN